MAFKREDIENSYSMTGMTSSPIDNTEKDLDSSTSKTSDISQITQNYDSDTTEAKDGLSFGAMIPKDMTVKLVRAESANWEIFLSAFYSLTLTIFGIFLGSLISNIQQGINNFTILEKLATCIMLFISVVLIIIWIVLKVKQKRNSVLISNDMLKTLKNNNKY